MQKIKSAFYISTSVLILISLFMLAKYHPDKNNKTGNINSGLFEAYTEPEYISPINVKYLRSKIYDTEKIVIEEELPKGSNYKRYIASYNSEGNKIFGLLTIPDEAPPESGYKAVVFIHGYIPPDKYKTTEKYVAYVDNIARNGLVVFKIDLRGHGDSEGQAAGSYFSPGYSIDAVNALRSLQKAENIDKNGIGIWGHSMAGNVALRAMEMVEDFKAGVIWAGAVYSYEDFYRYGLSDHSFVRIDNKEADKERDTSPEVAKFREKEQEIDFNTDFWKSVSLTENINYLSSPIQLHHAVNDNVVDINYQRDLVKVLESQNKKYGAFEYEGGGHNINSPYFEEAIKRTVDFYKAEL